MAEGVRISARSKKTLTYESDLIVRWEIMRNAFGDNLPIIPKISRVKDKKILYQLKIKSVLTNRSTNRPVAGINIQYNSNRTADKLTKTTSTTDRNGVIFVVLESRKPGDLQISVSTARITSAPLAITLGEAWYEAGFQITHYLACAEEDFSGQLVRAHGLSGQHRSDFLFSARGVPMQGTGKALNGSYVRFKGGGNGWHKNKHGHSDRLNDTQSASFEYTDGVHGRYETLIANQSIAVDPKIIPPRSTVHIQSRDDQRVLGTRLAHDTGGAIHGAHIDNYSGEGSAANSNWESAGGDLKNAKVRFVGY